MSPRHVDAWQVDDPPPDFAERVVATALGVEKRRVARRGVLGVAAAACALFAASKLDLALRPRVLTAKIRTEIELAPGAIAVLERGARLIWDGTGARQERGDVSYRVSPLTILRVETPLGSLRGNGACCRVKVAEVAGQATALFVSVARGDLDVTGAMKHAALHEGQYARVTPLAIETEETDTSGEIARELDLTPPRRSPAPVPQKRDEPAPPPPVVKRPPERAPRSAQPAPVGAVPLAAPSAGARAVIVPSCFCDRGDSLCACFH